MSEITIHNCLESVTRKVKPIGNGSHVTVPAAWIGKDVVVVCLEE